MDTSCEAPRGLLALPDESLGRILWHLDVPELLVVSRTSRRLRGLALDPYLHTLRLRYSNLALQTLYPARPPLTSLQPPVSAIYLSRTHLAARRLHWSMVRIRLNRSLSRRPAVTALLRANILPRECCRRDRASGEFVFASAERGGLVIERKRRVEREKVKEGLRVWLERKAGEIKRRRKDGVVGGVGVLVWRFTKRLQLKDKDRDDRALMASCGNDTQGMSRGTVQGLRNFWEGLGTATTAGIVAEER